MKILLVQNTTYLFHGGANKANRLLMEGLAARNHTCHAVTPAYLRYDRRAHEQFLGHLASRGLAVIKSSFQEVVFAAQGVEVHAATDISRTRTLVTDQIREFEPTWVLVSASEDPGRVLLKAALEASPAKVVCLIHAPPMLPFGPLSFFPANPIQTALFHQAVGVITVSRYAQDYLKLWGGLESVVIPFPAYGPGPFPVLGHFEQGYVTLINPSGYKGLPIFLELARQLPDIPFAAVPTWGTTQTDIDALQQLPNVQLLKAVDEIDQIFAQTCILLMPSLWAEGFPLVSVEAMLRGVPVVASNSGGLPEAKLGVDYVLPVRPIEHYKAELDDRTFPKAMVSDQDVIPWLATLRNLLSDRALYERLSVTSRQAALEFVSQAKVEAFEAYLEQLGSGTQADRQAALVDEQEQIAKAEKLLGLVSRLPPEKRALLARRLQKRVDREN